MEHLILLLLLIIVIEYRFSPRVNIIPYRDFVDVHIFYKIRSKFDQTQKENYYVKFKIKIK